jgi:hypothetical protein
MGNVVLFEEGDEGSGGEDAVLRCVEPVERLDVAGRQANWRIWN